MFVSSVPLLGGGCLFPFFPDLRVNSSRTAGKQLDIIKCFRDGKILERYVRGDSNYHMSHVLVFTCSLELSSDMCMCV